MDSDARVHSLSVPLLALLEMFEKVKTREGVRRFTLRLVQRTTPFLRAVWLCLLVYPFGFADHGRVEPQLAGTTLCITPASVQVNLIGPVKPGRLEQRLREELVSALSLAEVRFKKRASCVGEPAAFSLTLDARYLDPEQYVGFPENAHTYVLTTQVDDGLERVRYLATTSDIVALPAGETAELLTVADDPLADFVQVWRDDNTVSLRQQLVFVGVAVLLAMVRITPALALRGP